MQSTSIMKYPKGIPNTLAVLEDIMWPILLKCFNSL